MPSSNGLSDGAEKLYQSGWTWAQVPNMKRYLTADLTDGARVLFTYMCWRRGQDGTLWCSLASMAQDMGVSEMTIQNRLHELEAAELMHKIARPGKTSVYQLQPIERPTKNSLPPDRQPTKNSLPEQYAISSNKNISSDSNESEDSAFGALSKKENSSKASSSKALSLSTKTVTPRTHSLAEA